MPNFQIEQLKRMPQNRDQTWQGGLFRLYSWITGEGTKPYRPWAALPCIRTRGVRFGASDGQSGPVCL